MEKLKVQIAQMLQDVFVSLLELIRGNLTYRSEHVSLSFFEVSHSIYSTFRFAKRQLQRLSANVMLRTNLDYYYEGLYRQHPDWPRNVRRRIRVPDQ